jgi:ribosomal protein S18 acetylase RimI-like enzyme
VSFYERAGYRPSGERPGYYEDGMTALLFARDLSRSASSSASSRRLSRAA